jgi:hypothetical protein
VFNRGAYNRQYYNKPTLRFHAVLRAPVSYVVVLRGSIRLSGHACGAVTSYSGPLVAQASRVAFGIWAVTSYSGPLVAQASRVAFGIWIARSFIGVFSSRAGWWRALKAIVSYVKRKMGGVRKWL